MPATAKIVQTIESNLAHMHAYDRWTIGVTGAPEERSAALGYPGFWRFWQADSPGDAASIRDHFLEKGMKNDATGESDGTFVCLY
ncbi:MAG: hypothetical protein HQ559_16190 [Lentisphaerae bacterium]|nr:hypothetical protein [Lentisphaerota bacterium]